MKEYIKPYINDEELELEDIIASSDLGTRDISKPDEENPFFK